MNILIAGGSGLLGQHLQKTLMDAGHQVKVLSRQKRSNYVYWNPVDREIDRAAIGDTEVLINLSGKGIVDQRWSKKHARELYESRIGTNTFLHSELEHMPNLQQFISASGVSCYGYEQRERPYTEDDPIADDVVAELVQTWEASADLFSTKVPVTKLRISVVLTERGGALGELLKQIHRGVGAAVGSGKQPVVWIHVDDLCRIVLHCVEKRLSGSYNCVAGSISNRDMMHALAERMGKKIRLPRIPGFVIKLVLGKLATLVLDGVEVSNEKIKNTGFTFKYTDFKQALAHLRLEK